MIQSFYCPTKIFVGVGSHQKLQDIIKDWKIETLFVVADSVVVED